MARGRPLDRKRVLVVDDDPDVLTSVRLLLETSGHDVSLARSPLAAFDKLAGDRYDVVLLDLNFRAGRTDGQEGVAAIPDLLLQDPTIAIVVVTAHSDIDIAVEAMRAGAADFLTKPWRNEALLSVVARAADLSLTRRRRTGRVAKTGARLEPMEASVALLGDTPPTLTLRRLIESAARAVTPILVVGEPGSGRQTAARLVHATSERRSGPFISLDARQVSRDRAADVLLGEAAGVDGRGGRLRAAQGGTLYVDPIEELPNDLRAALLRGARDGRFIHPASGLAVISDARVVAGVRSTDARPSNDAVAALDLGALRPAIEIRIPPLRERAADAPLIARHHLARFAERYARPLLPLSPAAEMALRLQPWPGNIASLVRLCERAVLLAEGPAYVPADFDLIPVGAGDGASASENLAGEQAGQTDLDLAKHERAMIDAALARADFNITHAARALGLTRAALYRRMQKYGL